MRIRFNIGTGKSAVMIWGKGRTSTHDLDEVFWIGDTALSRVTMYKYLGVFISARGSWSHHVAHMISKAVAKTREIAYWARANQVQAHIALKVWAIYVLKAVMYGASICWLTHTDQHSLDRAQRQCARIILGFSGRSAATAVLATAGWTHWSTSIVGERLNLLRRITSSTNSFSKLAIQVGRYLPSSWLARASLQAQSSGQGDPITVVVDWATAKKTWAQQHEAREAANIIFKCNHHTNLKHFTHGEWAARHNWAPNPYLYNMDVSEHEARHIQRLIVGGQDLRGGDPRVVPIVTRHNCCPFCLLKGVKINETLHHVTFNCPSYAALRTRSSLRQILHRRDKNAFVIHRNWWPWRQVKDLRSFFAQLSRARLSLGGGKPLRLRKHLQDLVDANWA
jgi:hypothetical protein